MPDHAHHGWNVHNIPHSSTPNVKTLRELASMYTVFSIDRLADQTCGICQERYVKGPSPEFAVRLPACSHHFGLICISTWLNGGNNTCPMCRKPILDIETAAEETFFEGDGEDDFEGDEDDGDEDNDDPQDDDDLLEGGDGEVQDDIEDLDMNVYDTNDARGDLNNNDEHVGEIVTLPSLGEHLGLNGLDSDEEMDSDDAEASKASDDSPDTGARAVGLLHEYHSDYAEQETRRRDGLLPYHPLGYGDRRRAPY